MIRPTGGYYYPSFGRKSYPTVGSGPARVAAGEP